MKRNVVACRKCGREVSKSNIARHELACQGNIKVGYTLSHDNLVCQFCGKEAKNRNSLCNHERLCKLNPNRQISGLAAFNSARKAGEVCSWNAGLTADTDERVRKNTKSIRAYYEDHDGTWLGRHHTNETKQLISSKVKKFLEENPDMVPYLRNHSSTESYPEKYFKEVFNLENINLTYHYRIGTYELDFCDINKKIDIEIDGEQHYLDTRIIDSDKRRTEYLENLGWTIYRVRWSEYQTMNDTERHNIVSEIKSLLNKVR
jgi:very-short-patch-repair endonuclease